MSNINKRSPNWVESIYFKALDYVFSRCVLGELTMILPNDEKIYYGNGDNSFRATMRIKDYNYFRRCFYYGAIGFAESYMAGEWESSDVTGVINWMLHNRENHPTLMGNKAKRTIVNIFQFCNNLYHRFRPNSLVGSRKNISEHYDLGNDFFRIFLDPTMTYSSAYFKHPGQTLEDAQAQKYEELCKKIRLRETDHVLEIGSGWGGFAAYAAGNYGCRVTTITISQEQYNYAKERFEHEGLDDLVDIKLLDYRHLKGQYDKIISIEMIEAVGHKYLADYFNQINRLLRPEGMVAIQMIMSPDHRYDNFRQNADFIQKHIFPGSLLPSNEAIQKALRKSGTLNLFDYEDITPHYVRTLAIWRDEFNRNLHRAKKLGLSETFIRKWNYYFSYCESAFRMRNISVTQAVFSRPNNITIDDPLEFTLSIQDEEFVNRLDQKMDEIY